MTLLFSNEARLKPLFTNEEPDFKPLNNKKYGAVYLYLLDIPELQGPAIKLGKGNVAPSRINSWLKDYPESWRQGVILKCVNRKNAQRN